MANCKCIGCFHVFEDELAKGKVACYAYMDGVPEDILNGADHDTVRDDQIGDDVFVDAFKYHEASVDVNVHIGFKSHMALCEGCKHYHGNGRCPAFGRIPDWIVDEYGHDKPYGGQNDSKVTFEKA